MSTSTKAIELSEIPRNERLLSEEYRLTGLRWADANAAADLLEQMKSVSMEQLKTKLLAERGDMPDNRAERIVKSSPEWEKYIRDMVDHRLKANRLKVVLDSMLIVKSETIDKNANARHEARLSR